jgi:hypothetical protein
MMAAGIAIEVARGTDGNVPRTETARVVGPPSPFPLPIKPVAHHASNSPREDGTTDTHTHTSGHDGHYPPAKYLLKSRIIQDTMPTNGKKNIITTMEYERK